MEGWFNIKSSLKGKDKKISLPTYELDGWPEWSNVVPIWTSKKVQTKLPWNLIRTRKKGGTNQAALKFDLDE